jgi:saccharopine dehydrogenase (NAD+, L-lysine-forming)
MVPMKKRALVLGGYGGAGSRICRLLLQETDMDLVVAGRRHEMAEKLTGQLLEQFPGRVSAAFADAGNAQSLDKALSGIDLLISAATSTEHIGDVAAAAIRSGTDYLDIHFPQSVTGTLASMSTEIKASGRCFITQAGFYPGLPSVMVRWAAPFFSRYLKARVGVAMNSSFETQGSADEVLDEMGDYDAVVYSYGSWRKAGIKDAITMDMGRPFGRKAVYPIRLLEMLELPQMLGLQELGVYVAGINWFVDYLATPLAFGLSYVGPRFGRSLVSRLFLWGSKTFSPKEEAVAIVLQAEGTAKDGTEESKLRLMACHSDVYHFTAAPVVATVKQYLDGSISRPGLWIMGHAIDPARLMGDLSSMGITLQISIDGKDRSELL